MLKLIVLKKAAKRKKIEKKKFSHGFAHLRALIFKEKKFWQLKKEKKRKKSKGEEDCAKFIICCFTYVSAHKILINCVLQNFSRLLMNITN